MCVLVEHVKHNYYARFHNPSPYIGTEKLIVTKVDGRTEEMKYGRKEGQKFELLISRCDKNDY